MLKLYLFICNMNLFFLFLLQKRIITFLIIQVHIIYVGIPISILTILTFSTKSKITLIALALIKYT
jgi:hypothetical protein